MNPATDIMELEPKEIAREIFTKEPQNRCHYGFFSEDATDISMIFEILLQVLVSRTGFC